ESGGDAFVALRIRDLSPHAWRSTERQEIVAGLDGPAAKGDPASTETGALRPALEVIDEYDKDRGIPEGRPCGSPPSPSPRPSPFSNCLMNPPPGIRIDAGSRSAPASLILKENGRWIPVPAPRPTPRPSIRESSGS